MVLEAIAADMLAGAITKKAEASASSAPPVVVLLDERAYKGHPRRVFEHQNANALSDIAVDCRKYSAVHIHIIVTGSGSPSATISLEGSAEEGGIYVPLTGPDTSATAVTADTSMDVAVPSAWVKVRIAEIAGTYGAGLGFTITVTPYIASTAVTVQASGRTKRVSATLTRPGGTTQYTAGDAVTDSTTAPTAIQFTAIGRKNGGSGIIVDAVCIDSANQSTKPNLRLYLFDGTSAPTATNENAAWAPSDADMNNLIGYIEFTSWEVGTSTSGAGGNCASFVRGLNIPFQCGSTVDDIWGLLVERSTYTPVANEAWKIRLGVIQD